MKTLRVLFYLTAILLVIGVSVTYEWPQEAEAIGGGARSEVFDEELTCSGGGTPARFESYSAQSMCIQNQGPDAIRIGGPNLTLTRGIELLSGGVYCDDVANTALFWCVKAGASQTVYGVGSR